MNNELPTPRPSFFYQCCSLDALYAVFWLLGTGLALYMFHTYMNIYEQLILMISTPCFILLGWHWKALRHLIAVLAIAVTIAIVLYHQDVSQANERFLLKYLLSSQSAILWMSVCFILSTFFYALGLFVRLPLGYTLGSFFCWIAVLMGLTGMFVRWYESYLIGSDIGHIPVSNLYEVFVLFCLITALFYLYYEKQYRTQQMGCFVLLIISCAVGFLLWYTVAREAAAIQPLVPALQSWWMKIHVPANFIGYGTFSLAAMVAVAYLLKSHGFLVAQLPSLDMLEDVMYQAITVGFAFFTIATILGALWAADAWGGYWSWDPKETWALIVWLNYAAWLHLRLMKGLRGKFAAWWALIGLLITSFAFLGVNLFLSGLHSYGTL